ncbi:MAG: Ig-like domain-containing protein [Bacteroidota bacterium]
MVTTSFTSGVKAGLAYVIASARGGLIKSSPVQFTISGGFPDSAHFSIGPTQLNIAGAAIYGLTDNINLVVGDQYGNPAQPGSVVFFSTTGGIIQASSSVTSNGTASATLTSGNPMPPNGLALITAQVGASPSSSTMRKVARVIPLAGRSSGKLSSTANAVAVQPQSFTRSTVVLFSGKTQITSPNNNFIIPVGSSTQINYVVSDSLGNPLVSGTSIQVTASGPASSSVAMTGDVTVNIPDTQDKKYTQFQVSVKDIRTTGLNLSQALTLTINVTSPNGINKLVLAGNLSGTGGITVDSTVVSRIVLVNPSPDSIFVAGVGGVNTDNIKFKVYNTFGLPDKNVLVTFNMPQTLGGGEYLSPASAPTDTGGNVSTTITSGTKYGEVLVAASTSQDSVTLSSNPKVIYIVVPPSARLASQVQYLGATATDIYVDGVGALENSTISYQVTDSLGIPITAQHRVGVTYTIQFFPNSSIGGGTPPSVIPSTDSTDVNGQLHTTVVSGTEAGVVQVVAQINVPGRGTLISQPVKISVHAGFPDQAHFTLSASHFVFAGLDYENTIPFSVTVGDTFSNPVAQGTAIYFHSQAGIIQTGGSSFNAYTDVSGRASVNLLTANPLPLSAPYEYKPVSGPYATEIGGRDGYFWVYAQTQGHFATNVIDSVLVVASGGPITVTGIPSTPVTVSSTTNVTAPISITVKDGNGNPLPDGTTINASIVPPANPPSGFQMGVSGDISTNLPATLPDAAYARFPGTGITDFTFEVVNQSVPSTVASGVTVTVNITITAPNIGTATYSFNAVVQ